MSSTKQKNAYPWHTLDEANMLSILNPICRNEHEHEGANSIRICIYIYAFEEPILQLRFLRLFLEFSPWIIPSPAGIHLRFEVPWRRSTPALSGRASGAGDNSSCWVGETELLRALGRPDLRGNSANCKQASAIQVMKTPVMWYGLDWHMVIEYWILMGFNAKCNFLRLPAGLCKQCPRPAGKTPLRDFTQVQRCCMTFLFPFICAAAARR